MAAWFKNLSERERLFVGVGGAVLGMAIIFQFLMVPLMDWRTKLNGRADRAKQNYETVLQAAELRTTNAANAPKHNVPLRTALTQTASAAGIDLVRVGADVNGQIEVQPSGVDDETLYQWFGTLQLEYGVYVSFADISRDSDGTIRTQALAFNRPN